ncbi:hypothetical protein SAMN04488034_10320 [Salinimicrobium catena]|uniref:Uncharacterized protein n=1 Tax=Salinimicrobium catena TaxID=390640 RepID=A0A1H5MPT7_9FLAO|nr:hypothetical protein [Salinimicrobium catena]SDL27117.1 hypothetical protein SAMN04488140_10320 [Salinimicrobium catena]SEE91150.1 hypothetical protein SAMN04488034_10320 [Salinimicrobium catena]
MADRSRSTAARELLEGYLERTGVTGEGDSAKRYLWTDAFAVQALFGLSHIFEDKYFQDLALKLIALVHEHLGSHHPDDLRKDRISGLSEKEAALHPTIAGLRIGKNLPERREDQSYNSQLEWERDGQYFHYLTRWIQTLLLAHRETNSEEYAVWALELILAAERFIYREGDHIGMYWKMDTVLSRPLVASTGAHDPLEGMFCAKSIQLALPERAAELDPLVRKLEELCRGRDWATSDALGIGGLLLNTTRAAEIIAQNGKLISEVKPQKLLKDSLYSLQIFTPGFHDQQPAGRRLAFREGGLSLGIRSLNGRKEDLKMLQPELEQLQKYQNVARKIEDFWLEPHNREARSWQEHREINTVTLACSLLAVQAPQVFS